MASGKKPAHPNRNDAQKPLLSACMIVRDEEADLERCLSSVQAVVDEIVIVDTGSRDGTVEIARGLGAKVHHFEWCDDFSAARNAGLEQAAGRWILQLDADEELSPEAARAIRLLVGSAAPKCWGFFVPWRSHVIQSGLRHEKVAYRCLLFRNHRDLRYRSRIHEYIAYVGNGPKPEFSYNDDIVIEHYGYTNDQIQTKGKLERNLRLLELAAAEEPQEAYHHFNLGKHYFGTRRTPEAVAELRRATALCRDPGALYLPNLYATLAMALGRNGEAEQVPLVVAEAERLIPELASDFYFRVGIALKETGKLDQALASLQRAIDERGEATRSDPAISTWRPRFEMGVIFQMRGELQMAEASYADALRFVPDHPVLCCHLAAVCAGLGQCGRALDLVKRTLKNPSLPLEVYSRLLSTCAQLADAVASGQLVAPELNAVGGELARRAPITAEVGVELSSACLRFEEFERGIEAATASLGRGENTSARANRGLCHLRLGQLRKAVDDFTQVVAVEPQNARALFYLGVAQGELGHVHEAHACLNAARKVAPDNAQVSTQLAEVCLALGRPEEADECVRGLATGDIGSDRILENVVRISLQRGVLQRAYDASCALVAHKPSEVARRIQLCDLLTGVDEWEEALKVMEEGWAHSHNNSEYQVRLADVLLKLGRLEEADQARQVASLLRQRSAEHKTRRVAFFAGKALEEWSPRSIETTGMGGAETAMVHLATEMVALGHDVTVYGYFGSEAGFYDGVAYLPYSALESAPPVDVFVSSRIPDIFDWPVKASQKYLWVHDITCGDRLTPARAAKVDRILALSEWHRRHLLGTYPFLPPEQIIVTSNGIDPKRFTGIEVERNPYRLIYSSAPDRGLETVLDLFPLLRERVPEAELHIFYGWETFDRAIERVSAVDAQTAAEMRCLRERLLKGVRQEGVVTHGRVGQGQLAREMRASAVWFHPTTFAETSCITAMEAQAAGAIPITNALAALGETVKHGILIDGDIRDEGVRERFVREAVMLLRDPARQERIRQEMVPAALSTFAWSRVAEQWHRLFSGDRVAVLGAS